MNLSPHFALEEFVRSETAARKGLDNTPGVEVVEELQATALMLERVREILGSPIFITSGYRCLALNRMLGSKDTSAHLSGRAVDFTCPGFGSPLEVAEKLASHRASLAFDQLIHEFRRWVHIGRPAGDNTPRGQLLTIDSRGTLPGLVA